MVTIRRQKAVLLTIALSCIETVKNEEQEKSFVWNKLSAAEEKLAQATDNFVDGAFQGKDMQKAREIMEVAQQELNKLFGG